MAESGNPAPGFKSNPDKKIAIEPHDGTVTVRHGETVIATTNNALRLAEDDYPVIFYIPFEDIRFEMLSRTVTSTHCPYKGDASYWQMGLPGDAGRDIMWAYEAPYDEAAAIKDHGAFYADRVKVEG